MKKNALRKLRANFPRYLLLAIGTVVCTLPMIYMISTSLRPNGALYEYPPRFFPKWEALTLENYQYILSQSKFYLNFLNSVFVSLSSVVLAALVSSAMAFVMGKFQAGDPAGAGEQAGRADSLLCGVGHSFFHLHDQGLYGGRS